MCFYTPSVDKGKTPEFGVHIQPRVKFRLQKQLCLGGDIFTGVKVQKKKRALIVFVNNK